MVTVTTGGSSVGLEVQDGLAIDRGRPRNLSKPTGSATEMVPAGGTKISEPDFSAEATTGLDRSRCFELQYGVPL